MTLVNSCSGMALEIVQRSNVPNDAWRNLESHYRAKGTREIFRLSHEINGKTMEPDGDRFKFMMENDRLAADLHRLGNKSVTELNILRTGAVVCARALSTGREAVRSAELKKAQYWQNWLCRCFLR